jgi:prolyl 4-hydroxylase
MLPAGESSVQTLLSRPGVQRVPSDKLELFQLRDFLSSQECAELMALIDLERRPSTLADHNGDAYFRTSETCDLAPELAVVQALEEQLFALNGIEPAHGEPVQGQRYAEGQEFKPHCDYFNPGGEDWERYTSVAGQRTWTFMIYLNEPEAGGATRFKCIGKTFQPEPAS